MSELFAVKVTDVTATSASLEVDSVHPDSGPPAATATFALMLLYDPIINSGYSAFRRYTHLESSPLAQAMDRDNYLDSRWVPANARAFVARAKVSRGTLQIWPTHPAWIEHLRPGMTWNTAAYNGGPGVAVAPRAPKPASIYRRSSDPAAGFRIGAPHDEDSPLKQAFIPLHGPNRYLADPVLTDPAAMEAAARSLVGQPVLVVPHRGPTEVGTIAEVRPGGIYVYSESQFGWGSSSFSFSDLRALGRAFLNEEVVPQAAGAETGSPEKPTGAAKKTSKTAAKKAGKSPAKKTSKIAAKKSGKTAAKKTSKIAAKKQSKTAAKKASKTAEKKASTTAAKKASKTAAKKTSKTAAKKQSKTAAK
jgi:hypothetical protein